MPKSEKCWKILPLRPACFLIIIIDWMFILYLIWIIVIKDRSESKEPKPQSNDVTPQALRSRGIVTSHPSRYGSPTAAVVVLSSTFTAIGLFGVVRRNLPCLSVYFGYMCFRIAVQLGIIVLFAYWVVFHPIILDPIIASTTDYYVENDVERFLYLVIVVFIWVSYIYSAKIINKFWEMVNSENNARKATTDEENDTQTPTMV